MRVRLTVLPVLSFLLMVHFGLFLSIASAKSDDNPARDEFLVKVVSSAPHQVAGGDSRLHIEVPRTVPLHQVEVWVNGVDQRSRFSVMPGTRTLTGVIKNLELGANDLHVKANGNGKGRPSPVSMTLTNYPITGPIFSGEHQYPFVCADPAEDHGLNLPIDDQPECDDLATGTKGCKASDGYHYSRNCSLPTQVVFLYRSTSDAWKVYTPRMERPADMAQTTTIDGLTVDFIVRWERGTINRFIYSIAVLAPYDDDNPDNDANWKLNRDAWNKRVIYHFDSGVGIGHTQGSLKKRQNQFLHQVGLARGYAVLYSSGTRTSTHYNLQLGGETALMVKERFIERYDVPLYTVGLGGSGGGIQQYLYAQNHPGLIDAAIPQYAYPDMVTQVVHIGDCELLEFYMDVLDANNPRWTTWTHRTLLEGLAASDTFLNPYTGGRPGSTECIEGWRGLSPLVLNPKYWEEEEEEEKTQQNFEPPEAIKDTEWTHFADLVNIVGQGANGYARRYWDNVGVQYGLQAVATKKIEPDEFLKLNAAVGGWKEAAAMDQEVCPFYLKPGCFNPAKWDPWSASNQVSTLRTEGDVEAMRAVYRAGLVFMGNIDIPIIDWRHYLERRLDMHNTQQSFAARQRMLNVDGDASNQVIWFTDVLLTDDDKNDFDQTPEALEVMDEWMSSILARPQKGVVRNKPARAVDRCFDASGTPIASGPTVWDGILDNNSSGKCTQQFKIYSTSRRVAGGPFEQSLFKCQLVTIGEAIDRGFYGLWVPSVPEMESLMAIFPQGVCDYSQPDQGLPPEWKN